MADIDVEIIYALRDTARAVSLRLPAGTCVGEALRRAASLTEFAGLDLAAMPVAVFGRRAPYPQLLQAGDRLELLRALPQDPKEARRRRVSRSGGS